MSVIKVTVAQWGALLQNNTINAADTYTIVDTAQNIAGLPATQIAGDFLVGIESTDTSLMLDAAQAEAVLNITQDGETAPPYVQLSAPSGDQVILVDSFANVTSLSSFYIAQLESAGLNAVDITATAADIAALTESQILAAVALLATATLGKITFTATDTSVVLSTTKAIDFENAANPGTIQIVAPTNQTVAVAGSAASLAALSNNQLAALQLLGVQSLTVNDDVRPEFSIGQLATLAEASLALNESLGIPLSVSDLINDEANPAGLTPGDAYVLQAGPSDFTSNLLSVDVIADAPQQVVSIRVDGSVVLSLAQAEALESASLIVTVPEGFTVTVVGSAAALEGLSDNRLAALKAVGVTAIAASGDTPTVFSADQMQALQIAGIPIVAPPDNASQNDGSYDVLNPNGLTIDVTWDSSVASAPPDFEQTVEAGVNILEQTITNKITVDIDVGYGEYANDSLLPAGISEGGPQSYSLSYSDLRSLLALDGTTAAAILGVNSLPNTSSLDGQSNFFVGTAEAKALGLLNNDGTVTSEGLAFGLSDDGGLPDGWTGFGTGFTGTSLIDATLHEIAHALGRTYGTSALSLYRYTISNGQAVHYFQGGNPPPDAAPSYFSIDGGASKIADFGESSDPADFLNYPKSPLTPNDPFDEAVEGDGDLTPQDLVMLNVLGFQISSIESFTASDIEAFTSTDLGYLASVDAFEIEIKPPDSLVALNVAQVETWESIVLVSILASPGDTVALTATASDIAGMSELELDGLASIGVNRITVTDGANLVMLYAARLEDLYAIAGGQGSITPLPPTAPDGGGLTLVDSVSGIDVVTAVELDELASINVSKIIITDWAAFKVADAETIETTYAAAAALGTPPIPMSAPAGDKVTVTDSADAIAGMSATQLGALSSIGIAAINPIGGTLNVADAEILETTYAAAAALGMPPIPLSAPGGGGVTVVDTDTAIEGMSAEQISALPSIGVSVIAPSTFGTLELNIAQGVAIEDASLILSLPPFVPGGALQFADTAANIEAFSTNAAQFLALSNLALADGATELVAKNGPVVLSVTGALAFVDAPFRLVLPQGVQLDVLDTPSAVSALTTTQIGEMAALGVSMIATHGGIFELDVSQINALESAGITVSTAPLFVMNIITDTAAHIAALTSREIEGLAGLSQDPFQFESTTGPITFDVNQIQAIVSVEGTGITPGTSYSVADTAANIETLTSEQITASADDLGTFPELITVTAGSAVVFDLAQALAAVGPFYLSNGASVHFSYDALQLPGLEFKVADTAADFEALTPSQIDALGHFNETDVNLMVAANDASIVFSTVQAETAAADGLSISVPAADTVSIADNAVNIRGFLDHGSGEVSQVEQVLNISGIAATDGSVALTVSQSEALETANEVSGNTVAVTAPAGDAVILADNAAAVALMSPTQLAELPSIGVTAIVVTDQSIMLSVNQALALFDLVPISVPTGDQIIVSDTESAINDLTPVTRSELSSIGAQVIEIGPLTVAGGETLAVSGAVPNDQTITFAGAGGTLSLDDTAGIAGTIYGFSPPDTIDLTDIADDPSGTAQVETDAGTGQQFIRVTENGESYNLQIDPSQTFLTTPTFELNPDTTSGTAITVVEPVFTGQVQVASGETVDGVVIGAGGKVEVAAGAAVNRAVVESGAELLGDSGSTVADTTIDTGGLLDLSTASGGSGTINFGPPVADPVGGALEIDDTAPLNASITGFADGDTIDLTAIPYDANGSANLFPKTNVLNVSENGITYTLQFDPSQDFTGEYFHLAPDSGGAEPGTDITENTTPCYCRGTLIRTEQGEVAVEDLAIGDKAMTMSGSARPIKWMGTRSYGGRFVMDRKDILPICIKAGALADNVPQRDLWISPHHAMYMDGMLIEAKDLLNGLSIVQAERVDKVEYFHVELDTHDVIIAEGALSETFIDDDSRGMFDNVHTYRMMYPLDAATAIARNCAPRLDEGYELEAVRGRISARAGLGRLRDVEPRIGMLRGYVDRLSTDLIEGWAQNVDHPEAPVCVDVYADGRLIGQVLANRYRADLAQAGIGGGHHSFAFVPPARLSFTTDAVEVRRTLDGAQLMLTTNAWQAPRQVAADGSASRRAIA